VNKEEETGEKSEEKREGCGDGSAKNPRDRKQSAPGPGKERDKRLTERLKKKKKVRGGTQEVLYRREVVGRAVEIEKKKPTLTGRKVTVTINSPLKKEGTKKNPPPLSGDRTGEVWGKRTSYEETKKKSLGGGRRKKSQLKEGESGKRGNIMRVPNKKTTTRSVTGRIMR